MAKIMLVEDDNNLREIYEARLLAEGHEIISAHDGEEALAMAVREKPELIISDVMMPKISGFDMLDILRSSPETKNTKVIMMTALSQVEDKDRADRLGADRYLVKSQVTLEDVIRVAKEVLEGTSAEDEPSAEVVPTMPSINNDTNEATEIATETSSVNSEPVQEVPAEPAPETPAAEPAIMAVAEPPADPVASDDSSATDSMPVSDDSTQAATTDDQAVVEPPTSNTTSEESAAATDTPEPSSEDVAPAEPPATEEASTSEAPSDQTQSTEVVGAPSTDTELHAVEEQIENFVNSAPAEAPAEVVPTETVESAPEPTEAAAQPSAEPPATEEASTSEAPSDQTQSTEAANESETVLSPPAKKVIEPLNDPTAQPDLNELLKKEEKKEQIAQIISGADTSSAATGVVVTDGSPSETDVAPPPAEISPEPAPDSSQASQNEESKPQDPNTIAL